MKPDMKCMIRNGVRGAALAVSALAAAAPAGAANISYLLSGTITDVSGPAAGSLTSIGVGDSWSMTLTIDTGEAELAGCDGSLGPCDYGNAYGSLAIGPSVVLGLGPSATTLVEVWNDLATIDGVRDGLLFPIVADGSIAPGQVDGLFVAGLGLGVTLNASALADASLGGTTGVTAADFSGAQQGLLLYLTTLADGDGDAVLVGAETTSMSVIPVPAAVWLLSSGLGLLGWLRRRALA